MELVETYLKTNSLGTLYDSVFIPVVTTIETDHRLEVLEQTFLGRLVVVRHDQHGGVGARLLGMPGEFDRLLGRTPARQLAVARYFWRIAPWPLKHPAWTFASSNAPWP